MSDLREHVDAPGGAEAPTDGCTGQPVSRTGRVRTAPRDGSTAGTATTLDDPAAVAAPAAVTAPNIIAEHTSNQPDVNPAPAERGDVIGSSRVFAVANQKGGVGKTTTAVNLGAALADLGHRVLIVDLDPQGNASTGLGIDPRNFDYSMYDVLLHDVPIDDCIEPTNIKNLFLAPSTLDLAGAEIELVPALSREHRLRRALEPVRNDFRYIFIDCPPSLGLITLNALTAASEVLVPIQCEFYALRGCIAAHEERRARPFESQPDVGSDDDRPHHVRRPDEALRLCCPRSSPALRRRGLSQRHSSHRADLGSAIVRRADHGARPDVPRCYRLPGVGKGGKRCLVVAGSVGG